MIEFGAASALPSIICLLKGISYAMVTDYPDAPLLEAIKKNLKTNVGHPGCGFNYDVRGYVWGKCCKEIIETGTYEIAILSDLVFNHSQHISLRKSLLEVLPNPGSIAIVSFTHHRTWLRHKDLEFIELLVKGISADNQELHESFRPSFTLRHYQNVLAEKSMFSFEEDPRHYEELTMRMVHIYILERL